MTSRLFKIEEYLNLSEDISAYLNAHLSGLSDSAILAKSMAKVFVDQAVA
jgi:hypothetical protein